MLTIKVNDTDMYYEIHGEGEPVVLIFFLLQAKQFIEAIMNFLENDLSGEVQ